MNVQKRDTGERFEQDEGWQMENYVVDRRISKNERFMKRIHFK